MNIALVDVCTSMCQQWGNKSRDYEVTYVKRPRPNGCGTLRDEKIYCSKKIYGKRPDDLWERKKGGTPHDFEIDGYFNCKRLHAGPLAYEILELGTRGWERGVIGFGGLTTTYVHE